MTTTHPGGRDARLTRPRRLLRAVAILACVPYLALKTAWVLGSDVGIPAGSALLDAGATLRVVNAVGVVMDAGVVVLALLLTQRWGQRVPTWLIVLPMWVATGLITPIVLAVPAQTVLRVVGGQATGTGPAATEPFLAEWVFGVVYSGFILQGLSLAGLFVLYARERWGYVLAGRLSELPGMRPSESVVGAAAVLLVSVPLVLHLVWATGATLGLPEAKVVERTQDFYAVEGTFALLSVGTVAGLVTWLFRRGARMPARLPVGVAVVGSAGLAGWGAWLLTVALVNQDPSGATSALLASTHLAQVAVGGAVLWLAARSVSRPFAALSL